MSHESSNKVQPQPEDYRLAWREQWRAIANVIRFLITGFAHLAGLAALLTVFGWLMKQFLPGVAFGLVGSVVTDLERTGPWWALMLHGLAPMLVLSLIGLAVSAVLLRVQERAVRLAFERGEARHDSPVRGVDG